MGVEMGGMATRVVKALDTNRRGRIDANHLARVLEQAVRGGRRAGILPNLPLYRLIRARGKGCREWRGRPEPKVTVAHGLVQVDGASACGGLCIGARRLRRVATLHAKSNTMASVTACVAKLEMLLPSTATPK